MSHPFHLVDYSPWPLFASIALFSFALSIISFITFACYLAFIGLIPILIIAILWWRDLIREAIGGFHTLAVQRGLIIGFYLFLLSEIMLFASMFWAFLHSSLSPSVELAMWPPVAISAINPPITNKEISGLWTKMALYRLVGLLYLYFDENEHLLWIGYSW